MSEDSLNNIINENWLRFSRNPNISENFLREYQDKICWEELPANRIYTEEFMREFHDKINWNNIFKHQNLSSDFIREFAYSINYYDLTPKNQKRLLSIIAEDDTESEEQD